MTDNGSSLPEVQNYLPTDINNNSEDSCRKLLPVNPFTQRLTFYKTLVFNDDVEVFETETGFPAMTAVMGIPAAAINPVLNHFLPVSADRGNRIFWEDGIFWPTTGEKLAKRLGPEMIEIENIDDIASSFERLKERGLLMRSTDADRLKRTGYLYLRNADGVGGVSVQLKTRTLRVPSLEEALKAGVPSAGKRPHRLERLPDQRGRMGPRPRRMEIALLDGKPVKLMEMRANRSSPHRRSTIRYQAYSTPGDVTALLELVPANPETVKDDRFCQYVRELEIGLAEIKFGNPYFSATPEQGEQLQGRLARYRMDGRAQTCSNGHRVSRPASRTSLAKFTIGLIGTYHQDWHLRGYSRGALLSTIALAPREQLQVEVFTWDRKKVEQEESFGTEYEQNIEINSLARASAQIGHELSQTIGTNASVNGGISVPVEGVSVNLGGSGGVSTEVTDSLSTTIESINEFTTKAAEKFKATHKVKIVQTSETGTETRTIRKIANPNSGRTLTLSYFEVLENYSVVTSAVQRKDWCVLVENPNLAIDMDTVLAYEHVMQKALLSPNYKDGFEAARKLAAQRWFMDFQEEEKAKVEAEVEENRVPMKGIYATAKTIQEILQEFFALDEDIDPDFGGDLSLIETAINGLLVHIWPGIESPLSEDQRTTFETRITRYTFWRKLGAIHPGFAERARVYLDNTEGLFDNPANKDEILRQVAMLVDGFDDDGWYQVKMFAASVAVAFMLTLVSEAAVVMLLGPGAIALFSLVPLIVAGAGTLLSPLILSLSFNHDDGGLPQAIAKAKRQLQAEEAAQAAATAVQGTAEEAPALPPPAPKPEVYDIKTLAEAHADWEKLRLHLEKHRVYYQNEIFRVEDVNERHERLKLMGIARFVENRILGFAGRSAMYPLRLRALPKETQDELHQKYGNIDFDKMQPADLHLMLPTAGVHVESVLGQCDALEPYLRDRRDVDLDQRRAEANLVEENVRQAKQETERMKARLVQDPPLLDNPGLATPLADIDGLSPDDNEPV